MFTVTVGRLVEGVGRGPCQPGVHDVSQCRGPHAPLVPQEAVAGATGGHADRCVQHPGTDTGR